MRLHLFGPGIEVEGGSVEGARTQRVVAAGSEATAWREAVASATADLRQIAVWPPDVPLLWAVDAVEPTNRNEPPDRAFYFHRRWSEFKGGPLAYLAVLLARLDLRVDLAATHVGLHPETPLQHRVQMRFENDEWTVYAAGWHGHFDKADHAVTCFRWLLTPYCRVVVETQDGEHAATWVERYEAAEWREQDIVYYRNPSDPTRWMGGGWRRETRQQDLIRPPDDAMPEGPFDADGLPPDSHVGLVVREVARSLAEERNWLEGGYEPPV